MNRYAWSPTTKPHLKELRRGQFWQRNGTPPTGKIDLFEMLRFDEEKLCWVVWSHADHLSLDMEPEYIYNNFEYHIMNRALGL